MSNLERLLQRYRDDTRTKSLAEQLSKTERQDIYLDGIVGSIDAFIFSSLSEDLKTPQLFVAFDKEEAAYYFNTITNLLKKKKVSFFPDSFKRPAVFEEIKSNNVLERTEVVNQIFSYKSNAPLIITYPEALFEKVVDPKLLQKQKIELIKDESLDIDTAVELMVTYGFERVEYVYEPGHFSIRGGIIDVFSFGNEWPYRIELFDDVVESIRTFNPTTQLSIQNIQKLVIIPNMNKRFKKEEKVSLFEVLPLDSVIWTKDLSSVLEKLQQCFEKVAAYSKTVDAKNNEQFQELQDDRAFLFPNDIMERLSKYKKVLLKKCDEITTAKTVIKYDTKPQPAFNKNFKILIDDLNAKSNKNFDNFILTENKKQIERFYNIFEDLGQDVKWHPVLTSIHAGFIDENLKICLYTDHQIFDRFHKYKLRKGFSKEQAISLQMLRELQPGDFVTHIDHGVGKYSGLEKIDINGHVQESVRLIYQNNDILYVSINSLHKISRFVGKDGTPPKLNKIGGDAWKTLKRKTKKKVKDIAKELIKLYAKRKASKGHAFQEDGYLQNELEASFIYEDTPDQEKATLDVKEDMQKEHPMDRLICGDVGFGKTEVAIRAAFKAVVGGKQVAILVPTTILALQHYKTLRERLSSFDIEVDYVNRFRTSAEKTKIYKRLEEGKIEILIGTHALLNKKVKFNDLGLLIIDEEQKFGVAAKEKLRSFAVNVDTLTLTATPIPRTLQFSLMAARDLSIIKTPPPNRQAILTERRVFNEVLIRDAIYYEVNRGGQVFFVHNRVKSLQEMTTMLKKLCPDVDFAMVHGQMDAKKLESTLLNFIEKKYDVLVCTNIIETGLDIANANTMIINNAHHFGMSDLHQLRGRIGRSNRKAYCYLFAPPLSVLTAVARKRLQTLEQFSDLGSGFHIAMKDLDIRGAGNLLGGEQSGFISDIGFETYQKILEEAIHELKENEFKDLFKEEIIKDKKYVRDVEVDTDIEMLIPDEYIRNIQERLQMYHNLDKIEIEEKLQIFAKNLKDRFGPIPKQVHNLFAGLKVRWICKKLGFERFSLKAKKMRAYFVSNPQSPYYESDLFNKIMQHIATKGAETGLTIKQSRNHLIMIRDDTKSVREAEAVLQMLYQDVG